MENVLGSGDLGDARTNWRIILKWILKQNVVTIRPYSVMGCSDNSDDPLGDITTTS
jgi:hypothetical protein